MAACGISFFPTNQLYVSRTREHSPRRTRGISPGDSEYDQEISDFSSREQYLKAFKSGLKGNRRLRSKDMIVKKNRSGVSSGGSKKCQSFAALLLSTARCNRGLDIDKEIFSQPRTSFFPKIAECKPKNRAVTYPLRVQPSYKMQNINMRESSRTPTQSRSRLKSVPLSRSKQYKLSELVPDCRLKNIEASGGDRDFSKWFKRLPPNVIVDKDIRTDRGIFTKDNFPTPQSLDKYLGIGNSRSPVSKRKKYEASRLV